MIKPPEVKDFRMIAQEGATVYLLYLVELSFSAQLS